MPTRSRCSHTSRWQLCFKALTAKGRKELGPSADWAFISRVARRSTSGVITCHSSSTASVRMSLTDSTLASIWFSSDCHRWLHCSARRSVELCTVQMKSVMDASASHASHPLETHGVEELALEATKEHMTMETTTLALFTPIFKRLLHQRESIWYGIL